MAHRNGTVNEACSCPMFCPCEFNTEPALTNPEHGAKHFWKFNMAYKISKGHHGANDANEIEAWKVGDKAFTPKGTTGFMVTVDMKSDDLAM